MRWNRLQRLQCPCSCEDFFQCKSSLVATPEVLCLIFWRTAEGIQKNDKRVVPGICLFVPTSEGHSVYKLETRVTHLGHTILCGHYVCYSFSRGVVTEINDNTMQQVLSQTLFENIASGGFYFSIGRVKILKKVWVKISAKCRKQS